MLTDMRDGWNKWTSFSHDTETNWMCCQKGRTVSQQVLQRSEKQIMAAPYSFSLPWVACVGGASFLEIGEADLHRSVEQK